VPRPAALPLDQGFVLQPVPAELEGVFTGLGEGQIVPLVASVVSMGTVAASGSRAHRPASALDPDTPAGPLLGLAGAGSMGGGTALLGSVNAQLLSQGFRAAGPNAIMIAAVPQLPGPLGILQWGHTAVGVRYGGRLQALRGFSPQMAELLPRVGGVYREALGVAGRFTADLGMLKSTSAMTLEIPVAQDVARDALRQLPEVGPTSALYTARPSVMRLCAGENCVLVALERAETAIGGEIGPVLPGRGAVSVTSIGRGTGGLGVEANTASQGILMRFMQQVEAGDVATALPEGAVASGLPTGLRVLKWGGRAMFVVGVATVPLEAYLAPPSKQTRTAVGATAGFLGGLAAGAGEGLVCGPGAPVCSLVFGIGFGIGGAVAARSTAEEVYDLASGRPVDPLLETFRDIYLGSSMGIVPRVHDPVRICSVRHVPLIGGGSSLPRLRDIDAMIVCGRCEDAEPALNDLLQRKRLRASKRDAATCCRAIQRQRATLARNSAFPDRPHTSKRVSNRDLASGADDLRHRRDWAASRYSVARRSGSRRSFR
jgi:hypothetical protein